MVLPQRRARARPLGFVANEYALAVWGLGDLSFMIRQGRFDLMRPWDGASDDPRRGARGSRAELGLCFDCCGADRSIGSIASGFVFAADCQGATDANFRVAHFQSIGRCNFRVSRRNCCSVDFGGCYGSAEGIESIECSF